MLESCVVCNRHRLYSPCKLAWSDARHHLDRQVGLEARGAQRQSPIQEFLASQFFSLVLTILSVQIEMHQVVRAFIPYVSRRDGFQDSRSHRRVIN